MIYDDFFLSQYTPTDYQAVKRKLLFKRRVRDTGEVEHFLKRYVQNKRGKVKKKRKKNYKMNLTEITF